MRKIAKVPVVMQMEATECGAASLAMVLAYFGRWLPLEQVRLDCGVGRDGSNAGNLLKAARTYGLKAQGYRCSLDGVKKCPFPSSSIGTLITLSSCAASKKNRRCSVIRAAAG